jgi:predicted unusual protein kinase regulating ubiquinone biosynthesis (AarF/ABC1/UbiB family)
MRRFGALLADDPGFVVPTLHPELTTDRVLAMSFVEGVPVESLVDAPQDVRDTVMTRLIALVLRATAP